MNWRLHSPWIRVNFLSDRLYCSTDALLRKPMNPTADDLSTKKDSTISQKEEFSTSLAYWETWCFYAFHINAASWPRFRKNAGSAFQKQAPSVDVREPVRSPGGQNPSRTSLCRQLTRETVGLLSRFIGVYTLYMYIYISIIYRKILGWSIV